MTLNKEELKNKIIYRSQYRGSKEMDLLMSSFVKSVINDINISDLLKLNELVNLGDEDLIYLRKNPTDPKIGTKDNIFNKFVNYKY